MLSMMNQTTETTKNIHKQIKQYFKMPKIVMSHVKPYVNYIFMLFMPILAACVLHNFFFDRIFSTLNSLLPCFVGYRKKIILSNENRKNERTN